MRGGHILYSAVICITLIVGAVSAQTTEFVYQGSLKNSGAAANGNFDFEFALFDAFTGGTQLGSTLPFTNIAVANGIFATKLDFGNQFNGANRYLEIRVRQSGGGAIVPLTPRHLLNSAPYSVKSLNTETATNAEQLGGVAANQYVITTDPRMADARDPLPGSASYVQNTGVQQALSNFNITGTGTANILNAATQFNIGGSRFLGSAGNNNTFAGFGTGQANTVGDSNSFVGANAGFANTTGSSNSFIGAFAGQANTTGNNNAFVGRGAGSANTMGSSNSFIGRSAGFSNTGGSGNSFVGANAGFANTTGISNSFIGAAAGLSNTIGSSNSFVGTNAGLSNTTGDENSFVGVNAGRDNTIGSNNSFVGRSAGQYNTVGNYNSFFGKSAGESNTTGESNSIVGAFAGLVNTTGNDNSFFGMSTGQANTTGSFNSFFGKGVGLSNTTGGNNSFVGASTGQANTTGFTNSFFGRSVGFNNTTGGNNSFVGGNAGFFNTTGNDNSFFGLIAGEANTSGNNNSFFGRSAGNSNTTGSNNVIVGAHADVVGGDVINATAIGANAAVVTNHSLVLGAIAGINNCVAPNCNTVKVGIGTTSPAFPLHIVNTANTGLRVQTNAAGGTVASFGGNGAFQVDAVGIVGGRFAVLENGNVGIGTAAPSNRLQIPAAGGNIVLGDPGCSAGFAGIGFGTTLSNCNNYSLLGNGTHTIVSRPIGGVIEFREGNNTQASIAAGGAFSTTANLSVGAMLSVGNLGPAGFISLCVNASNQIATCASSLKYKTNIGSFTYGLDLIRRLRPISFDWRDGGMKDVGFGAEDIAKIDPRFVTFNKQGEVEGVKYDRLSVAFVNAFKEQQTQIEKQQNEINELRLIVCELRPDAKGCGGRK